MHTPSICQCHLQREGGCNLFWSDRLAALQRKPLPGAWAQPRASASQEGARQEAQDQAWTKREEVWGAEQEARETLMVQVRT